MRRLFAFVALAACSHRATPTLDADGAPAFDAGRPIRDAAPEAEAAALPIAIRSLKGKKVLHVGDSMVGGTFGLTKALEKRLLPEGAKLVRHTTVSESLNSFDKGPALRDLLRDEKPDIVIITLGANDDLSPHPESYAGSVERIVKRVGDRECWWIGPPKLKNAVLTPSGITSEVAMSAVIKEHAGHCHFFDSTALKMDRAGDGLHPSNTGGEVWADAFWADFSALPAAAASETSEDGGSAR